MKTKTFKCDGLDLIFSYSMDGNEVVPESVELADQEKVLTDMDFVDMRDLR
jgi:hypothetical protein